MRVRAARGALNMSLDKFAEAIGMGRSTLIRIENGERTAEEHELERMAGVSGLPLGFFVADDLDRILDGASEPSLHDRLDAADGQIRELVNAVGALTRDIARHTRELQELRDGDRRGESAGGTQ